jgi:hypothetical protein
VRSCFLIRHLGDPPTNRLGGLFCSCIGPGSSQMRRMAITYFAYSVNKSFAALRLDHRGPRMSGHLRRSPRRIAPPGLFHRREHASISGAPRRRRHPARSKRGLPVSKSTHARRHHGVGKAFRRQRTSTAPVPNPYAFIYRNSL